MILWDLGGGFCRPFWDRGNEVLAEVVDGSALLAEGAVDCTNFCYELLERFTQIIFGLLGAASLIAADPWTLPIVGSRTAALLPSSGRPEI